MKYYSFSTKGYYTPEIHGDNIPADAIEISDETYKEVFAAQCAGYILELCEVNGVKAVPPPPPTAKELAENIRNVRAGLLIDLDALVNNPLRWSAYSEEYKTALSAYRQALLDIPQQAGFPTDISYPVLPTGN